MKDSEEPSYYEMLLSSSQVAVIFIGTLLGLLLCFFAGVWIGRLSAPKAQPGAFNQPPNTVQNLENLEFFANTKRHPHNVQLLFGQIDSLIEKLPWANTAFSAPKSMIVGETRSVRFVVSVRQAIDHLILDLKERESAAVTLFVGRKVKVYRVVRASLQASSGLSIQSLSLDQRTLGASQDEEWVWNVTATASGSQMLRLSLLAIIEVDGNREPKVLQTFETYIPVHALPTPSPVLAFVGSEWKWILGTLLIPLGAGIWRWLRGKRSD